MDGQKSMSPHTSGIYRRYRPALLGTLACVILWASTAASAPAAVVWAVGDGAGANDNDLLVAAMIESNGLDNLLYLGDVYESGTAAEFTSHYQPSYGRFKSVTYPTPGNHEWGNRDTGYYPYWSSRINGAPYYSFDVGGWHILSLNSESDYGAGGSQVAWLRAQLAANPGTCNIALSHRPRFSVGSHGDQTQIDPLWQELKGHAAILLAGHDHNYQRIDAGEGTTHFVAGTGGRSLYTFSNFSYPGLQAYDILNYGALRLSLTSGLAVYQFRSAANEVLDQGTLTCQRPTGSDPPQPPSLKVRAAPKRQRLAYALKKGVRVKVTCSEGCRVTTKLKISKAVRRARRQGRAGVSKRGSRSKGRRRIITLGSKTWSFDSYRSKVGRIPISAKRRALLRGKARIRVRVVARASDRAGNVVKKSVRVVLLGS